MLLQRLALAEMCYDKFCTKIIIATLWLYSRKGIQQILCVRKSYDICTTSVGYSQNASHVRQLQQF